MAERLSRWIEDQVQEARTVQPEPPILSGKPTSVQRQSLQQELAIHERNLCKLREQAAMYAISDIPLHLLKRIEAEETAIQTIKEKLGKLS